VLATGGDGEGVGSITRKGNGEDRAGSGVRGTEASEGLMEVSHGRSSLERRPDERGKKLINK
jgi:hypothetical protein